MISHSSFSLVSCNAVVPSNLLCSTSSFGLTETFYNVSTGIFIELQTNVNYKFPHETLSFHLASNLHIKTSFVTLLYVLNSTRTRTLPMEKVDLTQQFAHRLRDSLIAAGFHSPRSTSGVNIHMLSDMTGYSPQICRKYLRGQALPEPTKLVEIAAKLQVSPGWLLFGDSHIDTHESSDKLTIPSHLIRYIFEQAYSLYNSGRTPHEISGFLMDLIRDVSQINATEAQSKKIIDLALSSASHFSRR